MKYLRLIIPLIFIGLFSSCMKDEGIISHSSGEDVLLNLECVTMGAEEVVVTKAWENTTEAERYIRDLRVYIFNKSGSLVGFGVFGNAALVDNNDYGYWRNLENIRTKTGEVYIYAVANISTSQYSLAEDDFKLLTNIDPLNLSESNLTLSAFRNIKFNRTKDGLNPLDDRYMMVGSVNDGNLVTISRNGNQAEITSPTATAGKELRLYRILSKNTVNISALSGLTFTLTSYGLFNVPNGGSLIKSDKQTATFDASNPNEFARLLTTDQKTFSFYLPENIAGIGQNISTWQDREKNNYASGAKEFVNAPVNSTYLMLRGNYSKDDYQASVEYTIHLGDFSKDVTDFNVERNFSYIYNVTINGVNDIIVEAKKNGDKPAEEGIVLKKANANSIMEVDCHYEARVMTFTKSEVLGEADRGLMLKLETAFGKSKVLYVRADGVYNGPLEDDAKLAGFTTDGKINQEELVNCIESGNELDYNWLHFVRNTTGNRMTNGSALTNVAKYPGDNNQLGVGGSLVNGTAHMDVFSFLHQMVVDAKSSDPTVFFTGNTTTENITCFIDENYYPNKSWAEYVNKEEDRIAYFLTEDFAVSSDNKSIYMVIKYAIKQKSIWTFYNPAMAETIDAFGVESVSEETISSTTDNTITTGMDDDNGFTAAKTYQNGKKFYQSESTRNNDLDPRNGQQDQYTTKLKACMSRNRDADGSGTINNNEMRWYLATINQYKGISVGTDVFPTSARLFDINEMHNFPNGENYNLVAEYHYYAVSTNNQNLIYWAEEVVSTSLLGSGYGYAKHVRCVRTLESEGNGENDGDTFYKIEGNIVDLSRVNPGALRPYHNGGFPTHYETDEQNKLYTRFEIAPQRLSNTAVGYESVKGTANKMLTAEEDLCQKAANYGGAWRVPNARELSLMLIAVDLGSRNDYWASTRFNGNRYGNNGNGYRSFESTRGFAYDQRMTISAPANAYVRCVRDVQVAESNSEYNNGGSLIE